MGAADPWALADDTQTAFILPATSAVVQSDRGSQQFRILAEKNTSVATLPCPPQLRLGTRPSLVGETGSPIAGSDRFLLRLFQIP